ncbi:DddA-like double-stranded DNA deaminase toxin [Amycolatopsis sp. cg9]|uniref:DddA-like double-stranded DNA deaminase toxin n=1 Tax=Amycolatopsis sp. cg9 TaxID=3238801 RepID=UPI0035239880
MRTEARPARPRRTRSRAHHPPDPSKHSGAGFPPAVTRRGQKTHGRWFAPGAAPSAVTSGQDALSQRVNDVLQAAGCPKLPVTASADVELKIAAAMRDQGITDATVVINNQPCKGMMSCDGLLGVVLPPGSTLTVHGTDGFTKIYKGGEKPWWS